jgi:hypothetical protein
MVCLCDDCQAFAHQLGRADLLDAHGGSDVVQVAPAALSFDRGRERLACLRLGPKGLFRWYAACCNTPVGNTLSPGIPFVGISAQAFGREADAIFGAPVGAIQGKFAVGTPPPGSTGLNLRLIARAVGKILGWRLRGQAWPHPFFERGTGAPSGPVTVLPREAREALRPRCGPKAAP